MKIECVLLASSLPNEDSKASIADKIEKLQKYTGDEGKMMHEGLCKVATFQCDFQTLVTNIKKDILENVGKIE